jgi:hypothetical protein
MTDASFSPYEIAVPALIRGLGNLDALLTKAEAHVAEAGLDPATIIEAQLAPDMFPLRRQVQSASDAAKSCVARLAGDKPPSFADTETSFAELHARIAKTLDYIKSVDPAHVAAGPETISFPAGKDRIASFTRLGYLQDFLLPNFFFHVAIAHGILRQCGVPIGKLDYLGAK